MRTQMPSLLAILAVVLLMGLGLSTATTARAGTIDLGAVLGRLQTSAYGPQSVNGEIYDLAEVDAFSFTLHRELTAAAGQRVYGIYKEGWSDVPGLIPAAYPTSGRFVFDWKGDVEWPDRFMQTLTIGANKWTEWSVETKAKGRYNNDALIVLNKPRNEVLYWWDTIKKWLDTNIDSLECANSSTKLVNDEQSVRCQAPGLSAKDKIALIESVGIFTEEETKSVSTLSLELWLTKNDNIPVKIDISATAVDIKNSTFSGVFRLDVLAIESPDISVQLPRS